jgi:phage baseplate assembly protein V
MTRRPENTGAETERLFGNLAREGVIDSVDLDAGKVVVRFGEETTPPIDWMMATGDVSIWIAPTVGQQVSVICPEGDVERAYVEGGLPSSEMAPLFLGTKVGIRFKDGALITYDPDARKLQLQLTGEAEITAPEGVKVLADTTIQGDVAIDGDVTITGGLTADKTVEGKQDVVGAGKSLKGHTHSGVSSGTSFSGPPR